MMIEGYVFARAGIQCRFVEKEILRAIESNEIAHALRFEDESCRDQKKQHSRLFTV